MTVIDLDTERQRRRPAIDPVEAALDDALADAEARVAILEQTLMLTARDCARTRERAERAEATLRAAGIVVPAFGMAG